MATNLLWFVLAGFLLGFATSTLWEWFYFRKERLKITDRRIRELEAKLREAEGETDSVLPPTSSTHSPVPTVASVIGASTRTSAWGDSGYRSPGVFLESEEYDTVEGEKDAGERERPLSSAPSTPVTPPVVPTVNSLTSPPASPPPASHPPATPPSAAPAQSTGGSAESPFAPRPKQPTPADALRAKRNAGPRSRQEVLAALRRNSEAVQRGQFPPPEQDAVPGDTFFPVVPKTNTQVGPASGDQQSPHNPPQAAPPKESPVLSPARLRWVNNPKLTERSREYPDDLSKIKGIGEVYKQRLYRAGIYTWRQIAEGDVEMLRRATSAYPSSNVEEWLVQAEQLMERHGRKDAVYNGPPPDDLTRILGIGPVSASVLYRAGICTYEQLASTPVADLEALFPIAVAGDQPDFEQWVARAAALADEKYRDA